MSCAAARPASATVLRFLPPMIWGDEQVDELLVALKKVLG